MKKPLSDWGLVSNAAMASDSNAGDEVSPSLFPLYPTDEVLEGDRESLDHFVPSERHDAAFSSLDRPPFINCMCGMTYDDGNTIYCKSCGSWQHITCYYPYNTQDARQAGFTHSCMDCRCPPLDYQDSSFPDALDAVFTPRTWSNSTPLAPFMPHKSTAFQTETFLPTPEVTPVVFANYHTSTPSTSASVVARFQDPRALPTPDMNYTIQESALRGELRQSYPATQFSAQESADEDSSEEEDYDVDAEDDDTDDPSSRTLLQSQVGSISAGFVEPVSWLKPAPQDASSGFIAENYGLDNVTVFSDPGEFGCQEDVLASRFAEKVRSDLDIHPTSIEAARGLETVLPRLFKDFALAIAHVSDNQLGRDTMYHVYKNSEWVT